ncbi:hypothetical protein GCM10025857_16310 [Alicyclobacillus contaminans]|nr:hypothetical protein GCM10025857_16310 [Alicyclobacillus contaminans]
MGGLVFQTAFLAAVWIPTAHDAAQLGGWRWWQANGDGLTLTAVPLFVGCSLLVTVQPVRRAVVRQAGVHLLLAVCLAGGAAWGLWQDAPASLVAAFAVWMVLEGAVILFLRQEQRQDGRYAETPAGVRVLAVVPKSGAAELGLQPGEVITHVNQVPVHSSYDLHFALDQNPAYAKLQVVDTRGEARFVGAPVYDGERHQLGLIAAPSTHMGTGCKRIAPGLFQSLYLRVGPGGGGTQESVEASVE